MVRSVLHVLLFLQTNLANRTAPKYQNEAGIRKILSDFIFVLLIQRPLIFLIKYVLAYVMLIYERDKFYLLNRKNLFISHHPETYEVILGHVKVRRNSFKSLTMEPR